MSRSPKNMKFDPKVRAELVERILSCLEKAAPDSKALLRGSLAANSADQYSDIDVIWEVPDSIFRPCIDNLGEIVSKIHPIESLRSDPDLQNSEKHRLIFVRFEGIPLFWRLDLEIFAHSIGRDEEYDLRNPDAKGSEWSLPESALMNAIAAVKAHLRDNDDEAEQLLKRAYKRLGLDFPAFELGESILNLADEAKTLDQSMSVLAEGIKTLVLETF